MRSSDSGPASCACCTSISEWRRAAGVVCRSDTTTSISGRANSTLAAAREAMSRAGFVIFNYYIDSRLGRPDPGARRSRWPVVFLG